MSNESKIIEGVGSVVAGRAFEKAEQQALRPMVSEVRKLIRQYSKDMRVAESVVYRILVEQLTQHSFRAAHLLVGTPFRVLERVTGKTAAPSGNIELAILRPFRIGEVSGKELKKSDYTRRVKEVVSVMRAVETGGAIHFDRLATALWNVAWAAGALSAQ